MTIKDKGLCAVILRVGSSEESPNGSGEQGVERFAYCSYADQLAIARQRASIGGVDVGVGHDAAAESHLRGFADSQRRLGDPTHLAGQTDFAEHGGRRGDWTVAYAGGDGGKDAKVRGRLVDGHPARDIHEHIVADEIQSGALLQ